MMYADDFDGYFTPSRSDEPGTTTLKISWDDLLSDYDGRALRQDQKNRQRLLTAEPDDVKGGNRLYLCPSDKLTRDSRHIERSYVMNRYHVSTTGILGITDYNRSVKMAQVRQPDKTVSHASQTRIWNRLGDPNGADIQQPHDVINQSTGLHGAWMFNYLFCDGHVKTWVYDDFLYADWRYDY